ncbi:unnamed protein product [Allacma fusca]|uniref:Uncharacterized protein n=1 Tax=Allacma fusca TaxID=39272 RepID=A0A8J2LLN8_9HEXA|nr:unnamed protein product [Allacma fusca]
MGKAKSLSIVCVICGPILIITVGLIGWIVVPKIIDDRIKDQTRLTNEETREKWENITRPIQLKFYIYNCTNPKGYLTGEKFHFEERGPYVYNEARFKTTEFSNDDSNVSYSQNIFYYFDEKASIGSENDVFNIPNVPLITIPHVAYATYPEEMLGIVRNLMLALVHQVNDGLFKEKVSVRDMLFHGWALHDLYKNGPFPDGLFGLYKDRNGSTDGQYVINTGHESHDNFGKILTWEGQEELSYWYTQGLNRSSSQHYCNKINGSDGSLFPPFITKDSTLRMFNTDICRSIWLTYNSETTFRNIPGYKFTIPSEMFDDPNDNENNRCFCQQQSPKVADQCGKSTSRIFRCKEGAPIVTSNPHFLDGDDELFKPIEITPPQRALHETFLEVEPRSGVLMRASKKIQINVEVQNLPFALFENLDFSGLTESPSVFLPIFWAEELAYMDESSADDLYNQLVKSTRALNIARVVIIVIGGIITFVSAAVLFTALRKNPSVCSWSSFVRIYGLSVNCNIQNAQIRWARSVVFRTHPVKEETRLETNSSTFNKWQNVEVPIVLKLTFFNITNPDAIEKGQPGEKFNLTEVGPFVWVEKRYKEIIAIDDNEDSISYKEYTTYTFSPELSGGRSDQEEIYMVNFPFVAVSTILKKTIYSFANLAINSLVKDGERFVRKVKVAEVMFDGISLNPTYNALVSLSPGGPPEEFSGGKFAFYKSKNNSHDGLYKIKRGIDNHKTFGNILAWEGEAELSWWTDPKLPSYEEQYCNKINGSDGSLFPPFVTKERTMRIFVDDICRSIYLKFNKEMNYQGIDGYQFTIPPVMFEDPTINKDNQCFCTDPGFEMAKYCAAGLVRIFACKSGAPVVVSNPHFLDASDMFRDGVVGMRPEREIHGTQIEVEPRSGLLLRARKRIQFNVEMQPLAGITAFNNVTAPSVVVPLFWAEEEAAINTDDVEELKDTLMKPLKTVKIAQWTVIAVLVVMSCIGGFITAQRLRKSKEVV